LRIELGALKRKRRRGLYGFLGLTWTPPFVVHSVQGRRFDYGKMLVFLTNNTILPPLTIATLYKNRWQVELFFKWIKQHLRIKTFLGTSENAVKTQIWCAVSICVLIAIIKKELQLDASPYTLLQILSVFVFEKTGISRALQLDLSITETPLCTDQLIF
jgi:IS4 transposase